MKKLSLLLFSLMILSLSSCGQTDAIEYTDISSAAVNEPAAESVTEAETAPVTVPAGTVPSFDEESFSKLVSEVPESEYSNIISDSRFLNCIEVIHQSYDFMGLRNDLTGAWIAEPSPKYSFKPETGFVLNEGTLIFPIVDDEGIIGTVMVADYNGAQNFTCGSDGMVLLNSALDNNDNNFMLFTYDIYDYAVSESGKVYSLGDGKETFENVDLSAYGILPGVSSDSLQTKLFELEFSE